MRKYGKYEKRPEAAPVKQPKVKNMLLQTYFTSLLCLVLCVTMFMGTSYAWFTSEVNNTGNEIYIGMLDVELQKKTGESWTTLDSTSQNATKLFDSNARWEPGYTALETIKIVNEGDLAFKYELTFTDGKITGEAAPSLVDAAKWFDVWVYHTEDNEIPTPADYEEIKATDSGWTHVGTLADALSDGKVVLEGKMDQKAVTANEPTVHTYTIALHMNGETIEDGQKDALNGLMGQKMELNVKLVATQLNSETDGFGNSDYDAPDFVDLTPESVEDGTLTVETSGVYRLSGNFGATLTVNVPAGATVTLDGSDATVAGAIKLGYEGGVAHSYDSVKGAEKIGEYTITGFTSESICVAAYNTNINIVNNKVEFINVDSANVDVVIQGNTIDAGNKTHKTYQDGDNSYGIYVYAIDYTLSMIDNTISNTKSHAIGINGRIGNNDFGDATDAKHENQIKEFSGNTISNYASGKSALKIWGDGKYTPESTTLSDPAKLLIGLVKDGNNTITVPDESYTFCFDQVDIESYEYAP